MKMTAEISLYPLNEDYIPVIRGFIDGVRGRGSLQIITNAMSTQICGEWHDVFDAVSSELKRSCEQFGKQVLVCKFIPGDLDLEG